VTAEAPLVSVVVPTRNEASNIRPLWERICAALAGVALEMCFVDDSDDETSQVLLDLAREDSRVRCLVRIGADRERRAALEHDAD